MSRRHLTHKQHQFLDYLQSHVRERKVWPTYREIVDNFGYRSPNSVTQNLQALARKGYLRRDPTGYHFVSRSRDEGSIAVRATIYSGRIETNSSPDRLSLTTLFPDLDRLHAIRLDEASTRTGDLGRASYVLLLDEEPGPGETAVVLHRGMLSLRRVGSHGELIDMEQRLGPLPREGAEILGRYVGHAGPYGVIRQQPARRLAPPLAAMDFAVSTTSTQG